MRLSKAFCPPLSYGRRDSAGLFSQEHTRRRGRGISLASARDEWICVRPPAMLLRRRRLPLTEGGLARGARRGEAAGREHARSFVVVELPDQVHPEVRDIGNVAVAVRAGARRRRSVSQQRSAAECPSQHPSPLPCLLAGRACHGVGLTAGRAQWRASAGRPVAPSVPPHRSGCGPHASPPPPSSPSPPSGRTSSRSRRAHLPQATGGGGWGAGA
eukprot:SAG22_NODE_770_length_7336_cov_56.193589_5_plen_215_part_00